MPRLACVVGLVFVVPALAGCLDFFDRVPPCNDLVRIEPEVVSHPGQGVRTPLLVRLGDEVSIRLTFHGCPEPIQPFHWHVVPDRSLAGGPPIEERVTDEMTQSFVLPYIGVYEIAADFGSPVEPWYSSDLPPDPDAPFNPYAVRVQVEVYEGATYALPDDGSSFSHEFTTFCCPVIIQDPHPAGPGVLSMQWDVTVTDAGSGKVLWAGREGCIYDIGRSWQDGAWLETLRVTWAPSDDVTVSGVHGAYEVDVIRAGIINVEGGIAC